MDLAGPVNDPFISCDTGGGSLAKAIVLICTVLLVAGCHVPIPETQNDTVFDDGAMFNAVNAIDPVAEPSAAPTDTASVPGRIPPAFQGRWGLVAADCTSTRGDAKGLMIVESDRLSFYESRATIANLVTVSATELKATLAFNGEGQEWTEETPLVLENNGDALTRSAEGQTLRYTRCGA